MTRWSRRTPRPRTIRRTARCASWVRAAKAKERAKEPASHAGRAATEQRNARTKPEEKARRARHGGAEGMGDQAEHWHVGKGMFWVREHRPLVEGLPEQGQASAGGLSRRAGGVVHWPHGGGGGRRRLEGGREPRRRQGKVRDARRPSRTSRAPQTP